MRKIRFLSAWLPLLVSAVSCYNVEVSITTEEPGLPVEISLTEDPQVRSVLPDDLMDQVRSFGLYVYNSNGHLEQVAASDGSKVTVNLNRSMNYTVYALANMPVLTEAPFEESDFRSMVHSIPYGDMKDAGIPMCGVVSLDAETIVSGSAEIELMRLIARVSFSIDKSELTSSDLTVTSVKLCQTASAAAPFSDSFTPDIDMVEAEGDYVSEEELEYLNAGGSVWLYCLENCQGTLLPDNVDPWMKVPSELSDAAGRCTYVEVCASYRGDYEGVEVSSDNVVYRFYLGRDNVSDFTLERNKGVLVCLTVSDSGVFEREWRVDYGQSLPVVTVSLDVTPSETSIRKGQSTGLKASYSKYVDGVLSLVTDVTSDVVWSVDDAAVASVSGSTLTGVRQGDVKVTASYEGVNGSCDVTVLPPLGKIVFDDDPVWIYPYKDQNVYFTYTDLAASDLGVQYFSAFGCEIVSVTILNDSEGYVTVRRRLAASGSLVYDNPTGGEDAEKELVSKTPELSIVGPERVMQAAPCSFQAVALYEWPDGMYESETVSSSCTWDVNGSWMGSSDGMGNYAGPYVDPEDEDGNEFSTCGTVSCYYHGAWAEKEVLVYMYSGFSFVHVMKDNSWDMEYYHVYLQRNVYDANGRIASWEKNVPYTWKLSLTQGDYYGEGEFTYKLEFNSRMEYINTKQAHLLVTFAPVGEYREDGSLWGNPSSLMDEMELSGF